jgi:hypothetical protein
VLLPVLLLGSADMRRDVNDRGFDLMMGRRIGVALH